MEARKIVQLMEMLGLENISEGDEWVSCSCPFAAVNKAHWKNGKPGKDSRPSFGISVKEGGGSRISCFTCHTKGTVGNLITSLSFMRGVDLEAARKFVASNEAYTVEAYENKKKLGLTKMPRLVPGTMAQYSHITNTHAYLGMRGVTQEAIDRFKLRFDRKEKRVIFPIFDQDRRLVGVRGRSVLPDPKIKTREYAELSESKVSLKKAGVWYGMQFPLQDPTKRIVVVEGEMDLISLWRATHRDGILASMGSSISNEQIFYLQTLPNPILIFMDDDPSGRLATEKLIRKLRRFKPGQLFRVRDYCGCNDPDKVVMTRQLKRVLKSVEAVV